MKFICDIKGHEGVTRRTANSYSLGWFCKHCDKPARVDLKYASRGILLEWGGDKNDSQKIK